MTVDGVAATAAANGANALDGMAIGMRSASADGTGRPGMPVFVMLDAMYGDRAMAELFDEAWLVQAWLRVESALAQAQAETGVIEPEDADAICAAAASLVIDSADLWRRSRNVGYPILPLVRSLADAVPGRASGRVHYGATTQDIMDSALALQLTAAVDRLSTLVERMGDALAELAVRHQHTAMAARTHGQHAVPTTFGAKTAALLAEAARHRTRLRTVRESVAVVSLFGAGGTSAAFGTQAAEVRAGVARHLGLADEGVPWHVARDRLAEFGHCCAALAATCARIAREVVDLSRTEVAEVREADGHHRGASSTMPQKANPVISEAIIGMSAIAGALASSLYRIMESGHERAAGEWQAEWYAIPHLAHLSASALALAVEVVQGLRVYPTTMRKNLDLDGGSIMAEAYMMALAPVLGRERAHDVVYDAARQARADGAGLLEILVSLAPGPARDAGLADITPEDYLGLTDKVCAEAVAQWTTAAAADGADGADQRGRRG